MIARILAYWYNWRWFLAKIIAPVVILIPCVFLLWIPQLHRASAIHEQERMLRAGIDNQTALLHDVDSARTDLNRLLQYSSRYSTQVQVVVPSLDSLRRWAERSGLSVTDLAEGTGNSGFVTICRFDLEGNFVQLLSWVDSLSVLHPTLQVVRLHWTANPQAGMQRLSGLELGRWDSHASDTAHSSVQTWLLRSSALESTALASANISSQDPFMGPVPPRAVHAVAAVAAKIAPLSPAPKLSIVGLVGGRLATVNMDKGERRLLRVGDAVGDWVVESISNSAMVLGNRGETKTYNVR